MIKVQIMDIVGGHQDLFALCAGILEDVRFYNTQTENPNPEDYIDSVSHSIKNVLFYVSRDSERLSRVISGTVLCVLLSAPFRRKDLYLVIRELSAVVISTVLQFEGDVKVGTRGFMEGVHKAAFFSEGLSSGRTALEAAIGIVNVTYERHSQAAGQALDVLVPMVCSEA